MLFLDLDGFKEVNDSLGHAAGDQLLVAGRRAARAPCVRPGDTVARFGGDEFAVLLEDAGDDGDADDVAERILDGAARSRSRSTAASIHVRGQHRHRARPAPDADDADQLLRNADLAMYRAKAAGEGGFARFDPGMHAGLVDRLELEADLRRALDARRAASCTTSRSSTCAPGAIVGVEALVRWHHPTRGLVPPASSSRSPRRPA